MAYQDIVEMRESYTLRARMVACAALEGIEDPENWVYQRGWRFAAQPGWADAWASAIAGGITDEAERGRKGTVISDGMILSAVQLLNSPQETV